MIHLLDLTKGANHPLAEYFHNKLVETIQFMEILNLKDSVEKDTFFRKLPNLAEQLPREIVLKKVNLFSSMKNLSVLNKANRKIYS